MPTKPKVPPKRHCVRRYNIYLQLQPHEFQSTSIHPPSQHINYLSQTSLQSHSSAPMYQGYQRQYGEHFNQNITNYCSTTVMGVPSPATTNNSEESEIDLFGELLIFFKSAFQ